MYNPIIKNIFFRHNFDQVIVNGFFSAKICTNYIYNTIISNVFENCIHFVYNVVTFQVKTN